MIRRSKASPSPIRRARSLLAASLIVPGFALLAPSPAPAQRYAYTGADSLHPRLKYADSLVSANDRCMVSHQKLNPRMRPVYVNGVPMGFC